MEEEGRDLERHQNEDQKDPVFKTEEISIEEMAIDGSAESTEKRQDPAPPAGESKRGTDWPSGPRCERRISVFFSTP